MRAVIHAMKIYRKNSKLKRHQIRNESSLRFRGVTQINNEYSNEYSLLICVLRGSNVAGHVPTKHHLDFANLLSRNDVAFEFIAKIDVDTPGGELTAAYWRQSTQRRTDESADDAAACRCVRCWRGDATADANQHRLHLARSGEIRDFATTWRPKLAAIMCAD